MQKPVSLGAVKTDPKKIASKMVMVFFISVTYKLNLLKKYAE